MLRCSKNAVYAKDEGLVYYKHIISTCKSYLNKRNLIAFEIGYDQGECLTKIAKKYFPKGNIKLEQDLSGKDRYLFIINE